MISESDLSLRVSDILTRMGAVEVVVHSGCSFHTRTLTVHDTDPPEALEKQVHAAVRVFSDVYWNVAAFREYSDQTFTLVYIWPGRMSRYFVNYAGGR